MTGSLAVGQGAAAAAPTGGPLAPCRPARRTGRSQAPTTPARRPFPGCRRPLQASLLEYAKGLAEAAADGAPITDAVLAVPASFAPQQVGAQGEVQGEVQGITGGTVLASWCCMVTGVLPSRCCMGTVPP